MNEKILKTASFKKKTIETILVCLGLTIFFTLIMAAPVMADIEASINEATTTIATMIRNVSGGMAIVCGTICGVKYFTSGRQQNTDGAVDWAKRIGLGLGGIAVCAQIVEWVQTIA